MGKYSVSFCFLTLVFLVACSVGPHYEVPEIAVTSSWKTQQPTVALPKVEKWWQIFEDEKLNAFIEQAICSSPSLVAIGEKVEQARNFSKMAQSRLFPQLNFDPSASNTALRVNSFGSTSQPPPTLIKNHIEEYTLPLTLIYELDFWGKWRNQYRSAYYRFEAEQYGYDTALLFLSTDLANAYFQLRIQDAQIEVYRKILAVMKKALGIQESRYDTQLINYSNVTQSQSDYSTVESLYFDCLRKRSLFENQIAALMGISPSEFKLEFMPLSISPPVIPAGMPAAVLLRRPDLAEQERLMASLHAEINVAYASFFPAVDAIGGINFLSNDFIKTLRNTWFIGGNLLEILFDAGGRCANVKMKTSFYKEACATYKQKVLDAFQEVEDSLVSIKWIEDEMNAMNQAVSAMEIAYKISLDRYRFGLENFLSAASNEREKFDKELSWLKLLSQQYIHTLHLIKAIGGGWE